MWNGGGIMHIYGRSATKKKPQKNLKIANAAMRLNWLATWGGVNEAITLILLFPPHHNYLLLSALEPLAENKILPMNNATSSG